MNKKEIHNIQIQIRENLRSVDIVKICCITWINTSWPQTPENFHRKTYSRTPAAPILTCSVFNCLKQNQYKTMKSVCENRFLFQASLHYMAFLWWDLDKQCGEQLPYHLQIVQYNCYHSIWNKASFSCSLITCLFSFKGISSLSTVLEWSC